MLVVVDTNILVSALWSKNGAPAQIVAKVLQGELIPCYDWRIMDEYRAVLQRPKFKFRPDEINSLLDWFKAIGKSVIVPEIKIDFTDEADKKFYEVAKFCNAKLITGNLKHFPEENFIMSVQDFLSLYF
ncbi:MAG: putative toxin-antitoxin system toxin component, PIN family [Treponema sp.]|nr:putative toxin-antitoxin system toxin component, PIN family [Treponema sp.]